MAREQESASGPRLGAKVRALRRKRHFTQVELAKRLGISPSYLNLIEHNQRPLTAPLLIRLAQEFQLDFQDFAQSTDDRLVADLIEAFADPLFDGHGLTNADMRELATSSPAAARAILALYQAYQSTRESAESLAIKIYDDQEIRGVQRSRLPSEEVTDFIQRRSNHFPELEEAAEMLWKQAQLDKHDMFHGLARFAEREHGIEISVRRLGPEVGALRRYDPALKRVTLSESLPAHSRNFQLATQIGLLTQQALLESISQDRELTSDESRALCRVILGNYFAGAVMMPYEPFMQSAKAERYDIDLLSHRFGASFEQVCHRLTSMRRPGAEGVPFHMIRVDLAGNISKRFSASGIVFARFSGGCPRWNVFSAFLTPGLCRTQISTMPDGTTYFCVSRTVPKGRGGFHAPHTIMAVGLGCRIEHARELVYSDGVDLETLETSIPVGVTCRLCERMECEQRAFPSIRAPLTIDENVRGISFYAPSGG